MGPVTRPAGKTSRPRCCCKHSSKRSVAQLWRPPGVEDGEHRENQCKHHPLDSTCFSFFGGKSFQGWSRGGRPCVAFPWPFHPRSSASGSSACRLVSGALVGPLLRDLRSDLPRRSQTASDTKPKPEWFQMIKQRHDPGSPRPFLKRSLDDPKRNFLYLGGGLK